MGVDYSAEFGIGYEVEADDRVLDSEDECLEEGLEEYIYCELGDRFELVLRGASAYDGGEDDIFIVIKNPFEWGLDLTRKKQTLDEELSRLKVRPVNDFGCVGGLHVY